MKENKINLNLEKLLLELIAIFVLISYLADGFHYALMSLAMFLIWFVLFNISILPLVGSLLFTLVTIYININLLDLLGMEWHWYHNLLYGVFIIISVIITLIATYIVIEYFNER